MAAIGVQLVGIILYVHYQTYYYPKLSQTQKLVPQGCLSAVAIKTLCYVNVNVKFVQAKANAYMLGRVS